MKKEIDIIVITGPTSSGKSDLAVEIAREYNGEIISADSRQIYKDMNLGTGKVEGQWKVDAGKDVFVYKKISHHLIDFVSPKDGYNISHFKKDCERLIGEIDAREKISIICGGTGFWTAGVIYDEKFPQVKPNKRLRNKLRGKTSSELFEKLKQLDSQRAETIDPKNKQRLIRAIEIASELGGVPVVKKGNYRIIEKQKNRVVQLERENEIWNFYQFVLDVKIEELEDKIKKRLTRRFNEGMIEEIEKLKNGYDLSWKKIQSFGLAYFWVPIYLRKKISEEEMEKRIYFAERQYAKRQLTWLKKQEGLNWVQEGEFFEKILKIK